MKLNELIHGLEVLAPPQYACDWDNVGLLAGHYEKEVKRVLIALDATDEVVEEAIRSQADLLLTHHPLILKPVKQMNDRNFITRRLLKLIGHDVAYYAMHTNFDNAPGCMADLAARRIGLTECQVLKSEGMLPDGQVYGAGRTGYMEASMTVRQLGELVKQQFGLPFLTVYGAVDTAGPVRSVGICPGSGGDMISDALGAGVKVFITGDIKHHIGIDAVAQGLVVMDAGHYGLEHIFSSFMKDFLEQEFGDELGLVKMAASSFPTVLL